MSKLYIYLYDSKTGNRHAVISLGFNLMLFSQKSLYRDFTDLLYKFLRDNFLKTKGDILFATTEECKQLDYIPRSKILFELHKHF